MVGVCLGSCYLILACFILLGKPGFSNVWPAMLSDLAHTKVNV